MSLWTKCLTCKKKSRQHHRRFSSFSMCARVAQEYISYAALFYCATSTQPSSKWVRIADTAMNTTTNIYPGNSGDINKKSPSKPAFHRRLRVPLNSQDHPTQARKMSAWILRQRAPQNGTYVYSYLSLTKALEQNIEENIVKSSHATSSCEIGAGVPYCCNLEPFHSSADENRKRKYQSPFHGAGSCVCVCACFKCATVVDVGLPGMC